MLEWLERTKQPRTTNQALLLLNFEWMKSEDVHENKVKLFLINLNFYFGQ